MNHSKSYSATILLPQIAASKFRKRNCADSKDELVFAHFINANINEQEEAVETFSLGFPWQHLDDDTRKITGAVVQKVRCLF